MKLGRFLGVEFEKYYPPLENAMSDAIIEAQLGGGRGLSWSAMVFAVIVAPGSFLRPLAFSPGAWSPARWLAHCASGAGPSRLSRSFSRSLFFNACFNVTLPEIMGIEANSSLTARARTTILPLLWWQVVSRFARAASRVRLNTAAKTPDKTF